MQKKSFFARHSLLVLAIVFFFVPFAVRGSRYAVQRMKNDVKDWLPADFPETAELEWFKQRFLGEQFIIVTWDGCVGRASGNDDDDERFKSFVDSLFPPMPKSAILAGRREPQQADFFDRDLELYARSFKAPDDYENFLGNRLDLQAQTEEFRDWAGKKEKWLRSGRNDWVYITPKGELYQWTGNRSWPAQVWRQLQRRFFDNQDIESEFVTALGAIDGPWYYEDPTRLNARLFKSVTTGPSMLSDLTNAHGKGTIGEDQARDRLNGVLFGPNDEQTCIILTLTEAAKQDPRSIVGRGMLGRKQGVLLDLADKAGVQPPLPPPALPGFLAGMFGGDPPPVDNRPMLRLGGPPVDNAAIDEEGQITLVRLLGLSLAVGLGLSWLCFRSINITLMVFLVGGISAVTSVGIVYWTGSQLDAVLMSMPSLVYVLGISGAVHVVNYYRESVVDEGISTAPDNAVSLGLWPCMMATFTTSLGLISLATSNIVPIRKFGCYAAVGVIATLVLLFTFLPAALEMWPPRNYLARAKKAGPSGSSSAIERILDSFWQGVGRFVIARYRLVAVACMIALTLGFMGLTKIDTSVQLLKLFDKDAKIIDDYRWLESNLGKLVPMEIVVRVHPDRCVSWSEFTSDEFVKTGLEFNFLQRMEIAKSVGDEIERIFGQAGAQYLSRPMLASTFVRPKPTGTFSARAMPHFIENLEDNREVLEEADFLKTDPEDQHELWRVSLRLAALDDIDFGDFVEQIKQVVEPIMLAYEYRDNIIARLPEMHPDDKQENLRILFYGFAQPAKVVADTAKATDEEPEINQTVIFISHLNRLLRDAGIPAGSISLGESKHIPTLTTSDTIVLLNDQDDVSYDALADSEALLFDARSHTFDPTSDSTARQRKGAVSAVYTGLVPIVYKAQRTLLGSLIKSTGLAFVMIAVVMILLLRSPRAGLLSMLPNLFPVVVVFGIMGWWEVLVDIGSMMTASVAMGVAVDDTIHFLSWFRKGLDEGADRKGAILLAYKRVATAMTQTTAIGGIGLSIFAFSTFTPTQRFGTLMLAMLVAALIGDLLFLPALLASPFGKVFDQAKKKAAGIPHATEDGERPRSSSNRTRTKRDDEVSQRLPPGMRRDQSH